MTRAPLADKKAVVTEKPEKRWRTRLFHFYFRLARPMTLGVRGIVLDADGRVFLVRHTYVPGWHLPGGGVEAGETLARALAKELREEGNIVARSPPELFGMYFNGHVSRRDHVAVFVVRDFEQTGPRPPDREIAESGFFALDALPATVTRGTRARLEEALGGAPRSETW